MQTIAMDWTSGAPIDDRPADRPPRRADVDRVDWFGVFIAQARPPRMCSGSSLEWTNFHRSDQPVFDGETMSDVLIAKNCAGQVAHDLMHID